MSTEPESPAFQRFVESVKGVGPAWREAVDTDALLRLEKDERHRAEVLLIEERIPRDDWRAPPALAEAKTRGAVAPMKRWLPKAKPRMKIAIARALADLEAIPRADETVAEVLRSGEPDSGLPALAAAQSMRSKPIVDALAWAAAHHPEPEVRSNAGAQLFVRADLTDDPLAWDFRPFWLRLGDEDEDERRQAFAEICRMVGLDPARAG
jgi:hypothetical protein